MLDILRSLRSLVKISRVHTDGNIFRLHYSLTVIILMAFCIIITTKQYVGEPIDCLRTDGVDKSIINTYCWIHTTYSIPKAFNKRVGIDVSIALVRLVTDKLSEVAPANRPINLVNLSITRTCALRFLIQVLTTQMIQLNFSTTSTINGFVSSYLFRRPPFTFRVTYGK